MLGIFPIIYVLIFFFVNFYLSPNLNHQYPKIFLITLNGNLLAGLVAFESLIKVLLIFIKNFMTMI